MYILFINLKKEIAVNRLVSNLNLQVKYHTYYNFLQTKQLNIITQARNFFNFYASNVKSQNTNYQIYYQKGL